MIGWDSCSGGCPSLYQVDPSGAFWAWKASAIGKNMSNAKAFLERRYPQSPSGKAGEEPSGGESEGPATLHLEDAVHLAILALKEGFEGHMNQDNIEIGIVSGEDGGQFRILNPSEINDYLSNL